ncbi:MAG: DUF4174 domain-containing protein [Saprospiraceae bacterium]
MQHRKMILISCLLMLGLFKVTKITAQNLSAHQWENRVLLLLVEDTQNFSYQAQLSILKSQEKALKDRKILVYHLQASQFKKGLNGEEWTISQGVFQQYKSSKAPFEIVLMGLDGGVKLQQSKLLPAQDLFNLIDQMPMRKRELKKQKKQ